MSRCLPDRIGVVPFVVRNRGGLAVALDGRYVLGAMPLCPGSL
jgi:hypothetical protein